MTEQPFFTLITPSIQREDLTRCCHSVGEQLFTSWQHIVIVDRQPVLGILRNLKHPQRRLLFCGKEHRDYGNTCRNAAWKYADGSWVIYLDDDNYLASRYVLQRIHDALQSEPGAVVAQFPIMRHGQRFFDAPPRVCHVDTANCVIRREVAQWPAGPEYTMDGIFLEGLAKKHGCVAFPDAPPIIVMPKSGKGE